MKQFLNYLSMLKKAKFLIFLVGLNEHVAFLHTKFLLIDPFSDTDSLVCAITFLL